MLRICRMDNFQDIICVLQQPITYPDNVNSVKTIITAVSVVFLTGNYAYKINKPLNLEFLDFSTLEKRKEQCEKELKYNSLISPELYEEVIKITKSKDGKISINGEGEVIEYAVKMKQMDPNATMNLMLTKNNVTKETINLLAEKIFNFHKIAPTNEKISYYGNLEIIQFNWDENFEQTEKYKENIISEKGFSVIKQKVNQFIENNNEIFSSRVEKNKIKHCHGDFHSGNVFIINDQPIIFDGIVFNERFPNSDIIAEIAFMAMDLEFHGKEDFSNTFIQKYKELSKDEDIDKLLTFYKCYRAYIRGKISCFTTEDKNLSVEKKHKVVNEAKRYFELAKDYAESL
jgi:uncharacterized protein